MSSSRHPETDGLTERVNNMFQQLLLRLCCYGGSELKNVLPQGDSNCVQRPTRALGIEHTPFDADFCFYPEKPPYQIFRMRLSDLVSQVATELLRLLQEVQAQGRSVLHLHKDEMQAHSKSLTAPHFGRGDKVTIITKNLFLRGQPNMKLRDRQLGPFTVEEDIGKHIYKSKLPATVHS
jgi:hypothetical protein